jgi:hypothetical protein
MNARAKNKERTMTLETAQTEPAPPPAEDEHSHPAPVVRYCIQTDVDEDEVRFETFAELAIDQEIGRAALDTIRLLAPGEDAYIESLGTVTRCRRVRVLVALDVDCLDPADARDVVEALLANGTPQDEINAHDTDRGPMNVESARVELVSVLS